MRHFIFQSSIFFLRLNGFVRFLKIDILSSNNEWKRAKSARLLIMVNLQRIITDSAAPLRLYRKKDELTSWLLEVNSKSCLPSLVRIAVGQLSTRIGP